MIKRICGLIINVQDSKSRGVLESSIEIIRTQSLCLKLDQHRNPHKFFSCFSGAVLLHQTSPTTPKRTSRIPHFLRVRWIFEVEIPRFYLAPSWCMSLCSLLLVALSVGASEYWSNFTLHVIVLDLLYFELWLVWKPLVNQSDAKPVPAAQVDVWAITISG